MTDMEYHASIPELPTQENLPDWINTPINDAVGFDRYAELGEQDLSSLNLQLLMLKSKLDEFNSDLTVITSAEKAASKELERLVAFYQNMAGKVQRLKERTANIQSSASPKVNAMENRISMVENAIRIQEEAKRKAETFENMQSLFREITAEMPWREIAMKHQLSGASRMALNRKTILADNVGLGKTLTSIMTCDYIKAKTSNGDVDNEFDYTVGNFNQPPAGRRILYLCPAQLDTNIQKEFKKWATHRGNPIFLSKQSRNGRRLVLDALKADVDCVVIVNYEAWRKDKLLINDLIQMQFDTIVLDEAHYLKERKSIAYRGVAHLVTGRDFTQEDYESKESGDCSYSPKLLNSEGNPYLAPRYIYPMTGTPILNKPQELYTLLTLVDPTNFLANNIGESNFLRTYCVQDRYSARWSFAEGQLEKLTDSISNLYIRRTLNDAGIVLPPQDIQYHELEIDEDKYPLQAQARKDMREYAMLMLDDDTPVGKAVNAMVIRLRLRQIETMPSGIKFVRVDDWGHEIESTFNVKESQKLDYIIHENGQGWDGLLAEVCPEQRAVIYSQFTEPLDEMFRRATAMGIRAVIFDGRTPANLAEEIKRDVDRYYVEENGGHYKYDVVFCNYKVGGQGLNFTHFTQTIICDEEWNPGKRDQAYGRTNRMGQIEDSTVHVIRIKSTIDMWMSGLIAGKEDMINKFNTKQAMRQALKNGEL